MIPVTGEQLERRVGVPFDLTDAVQVVLLAGTRRIPVRLIDFALAGCAVACDADTLVDGSKVTVILRGAGEADIALREAIVVSCFPLPEEEETERCGLYFDRPISLESHAWLAKAVGNPLRDPRSQHSVFDVQREIAMRDLDALQAGMRDSSSYQFQLFLTGIPIFLGLLGTTFAFILRTPLGGAPTIQSWVIVLPAACALTAVAMLVAFLRKSATITRYRALSLLLQRYLAAGRLPGRYRGREDALANLDHLARFGLLEGSPLAVEPMGAAAPVLRSMIPATSFAGLCIFILLSVPALSLAATWILALPAGSKTTLHLVVAALTTGLVAAAGVSSYGLIRRVYGGDLSMEFMVIRLSRILEHASMFDPRRTTSY